MAPKEQNGLLLSSVLAYWREEARLSCLARLRLIVAERGADWVEGLKTLTQEP